MATGLIEILQSLSILVQARWGKHITLVHAQAFNRSLVCLLKKDLFSGEELVPLNSQVTHEVLLPLSNGDFQDQLFLFWINEGNILDGKVDVSVVPIVLAEFFFVLGELVFLVNTTSGQPGECPPLAGFDDLPQSFIREGIVALEPH